MSKQHDNSSVGRTLEKKTHGRPSGTFVLSFHQLRRLGITSVLRKTYEPFLETDTAKISVTCAWVHLRPG